MTTDTLKKVETHFVYSRHAVVPQIPCVQDVLFALRLVDKDENYGRCQAHYEPYIRNVQLVINAIGIKVLVMWSLDRVTTRRMIASTIVNLCSEEAKCLFNSAYVQAKLEAGDKEKDWAVVSSMPAGVLLLGCICKSCRKKVLSRQLGNVEEAF